MKTTQEQINEMKSTSDTPSSSTPASLGYLNRRDMLCRAGSGFGALALGSLMNSIGAGQEQQGHSQGGGDHASVKRSHHRATAKNVIFLFMEGGPSHLDSFDPKPLMNELAGQSIPDSFEPVITPMGEFHSPLLECKRKWAQHGESGLWVSDWLPHTAKVADELCVIRSCWGNGLNHSNGVCQMNSGAIFAGRPSLGSWVSYGLGSENSNLPAFVVMEDNPGKVTNGPRNWSAGFMPSAYQATPVFGGEEPIRHLKTLESVGDARHRNKLSLLEQFNRRHSESRGEPDALEARIRSYELAFRMQAAAPEAVDLSQETADTLALYGADEEKTKTFGRQCLLARRLVERGVRFVQLYHGAGSKWDAHSGIEKNHSDNFGSSDKPVAGLIQDLKRRGLLDETLVVWGGEFGRTPMSEKGDGRDHNPYGFTMWMAGGGVKGGRVIGETDELGLHAISDRLHIHDLHASVLYALGLDHMELTYVHGGRPERPTINDGSPCLKLFES